MVFTVLDVKWAFIYQLLEEIESLSRAFKVSIPIWEVKLGRITISSLTGSRSPLVIGNIDEKFMPCPPEAAGVEIVDFQNISTYACLAVADQGVVFVPL